MQVDLADYDQKIYTRTVSIIRWLNTHNWSYNDRATTSWHVGLSLDGVNFTTVASGVASFNATPTWVTTEISPTLARYVRLYVDGYYNWGGGINEIQVYNDYWGPCHNYELWGSFPTPSTATGGYIYRIIAKCDGPNIYSSHFNNVAYDNAKITYYSTGQINISLKMSAANPTCWFQLEHADGDYNIYYDPNYNPAPTIIDPDPTFSNVLGPINKLPILSTRDLGVTNGRNTLELSGHFPSGTFTPTVTCNGTSASAQLATPAPTSTLVYVSFNAQSTASSCTVSLQWNGYSSNSAHFRVGGQMPTLPKQIGLYYWAGFQPADNIVTAFPQATQQIAGSSQGSTTGAGFRAERLRLGPGIRLAHTDTIGFDPTAVNSQCPPYAADGTTRFLGCAATLPEFQQALAALPRGTDNDLVYVPITTYDGATSGPFGLGPLNYLNRAWLSDPVNQAQVRKEYEELALALYNSQQGTGRVFVISAWEGDNQIYCGSAGGFVADPASCAGAADYFDAYQMWMQLRKDGINSGTAIARSRGLTFDSSPPAINAARVGDGIEFATYHLLHDRGFRSVLWNIVPAVQPAFATYSAWESSGGGTMDDDLGAIRSYITAYTGGTKLLIGELGSEVGLPQWHFTETVRAAYRAQLPMSVIWQGFRTSVPGLLDWNGAEKPLMRTLRSDIVNYASSAVLPGGPISIAAVVDRGIDTSSKRWFELYGGFPAQAGTSYSASAKCMTTSGSSYILYAATTYYISSSQINISITNPPFYAPGRATWCTFSVSRSSVQSSEFGPRKICPVTTAFTNPPPCDS